MWGICHRSNLVLSLGLNLVLILIEACLQWTENKRNARRIYWGCSKKSIFVGLFFFHNKWLGEEKKKSLKLVSSSLFQPFGISWKINMSAYNVSLLMKLKRWRGEKYPASRGLGGFAEVSTPQFVSSNGLSMNFYPLNLVHKLSIVLNQF